MFVKINGKHIPIRMFATPTPGAWLLEITYPDNPDMVPATSTHSTEGMDPYLAMRELERLVADVFKDDGRRSWALRWVGRAYFVDYATH